MAIKSESPEDTSGHEGGVPEGSSGRGRPRHAPMSQAISPPATVWPLTLHVKTMVFPSFTKPDKNKVFLFAGKCDSFIFFLNAHTSAQRVLY